MKKKVCIVIANYYENLAIGLLKETKKVLNQHSISKYKIIYAPGVFEIPYLISSNINKFDSFIALGVVIKGETPHFDFISSAVTNAIMALSIRNKKPILNGIITSLNKKQAIDRSKSGKKNKGGEAARALIKLLKI